MNRALFLDRDGVINVEKDYLYRIEDFQFIEGIFDLTAHYQSLGYKIFVVTNQSGIARNYYTEKDFNNLTEWMVSEFLKKSIIIEDVYFCPHHPEITGECSCRKPKPGMILEVSEAYEIDLEHSIMIGDKERDIESALNAGIEETYLFDASQTVRDSKATKIVSKLEDIWK